LVVIGGDPRFETWLRTDPQVRKAEQAIGSGQSLAIVSARSLDLTAFALPCASTMASAPAARSTPCSGSSPS
jgi:hypothetical protein